MTVLVRSARRDDMKSVCEIYNQYILESAATFEFEAHEPAEWEELYDEVIQPGSHLLVVADNDGEILGYAKTSDFNEREGYSTSVQLSIFIKPEATGQGIGSALYDEVIPLLENRWHRVYAGIALPNPGSIALHKRFGFERCALYKEVGFKLDRFWDVAWYEKALD
jgi:phosphinothricin acetyltransferase